MSDRGNIKFIAMQLKQAKRFTAVILASIWIASMMAAGVRINVVTPPGKRGIAVGDIFYIQYTVADLDATPSQPSVPGGKVLYFDRTGSSTSMTSVNGHTTRSSSVTYTATVRAAQEGSFSFGPVNVGGAKSNTVSYTIGARGSNSPAPQQSAPDHNQSAGRQGQSPDPQTGPKYIGKGDGNLFLRASVSKTNVYEGEAIVYTVKLYTTYDGIRFIGATAAPKFEGFVIEESKNTSSQLAYETYQGKTYATAVIARYIIFPQMSGTLNVLGNTYTVSVDEREYYHDPYWGNMSVSRPLQLSVKPNDLSLSIKPLPQPQPANFSGGVGRFHIASSFPSKDLKTNQAASVVYTVTGTGNLKYVKIPDLNSLYPSELEVYSPKTDVKSSVGADNVSGRVRFDYSVMPLETGSFTIPPVELVYFDPTTGKYETSTASGTKVDVTRGQASSKSQTKERLSFEEPLMPVGNVAKEHTAVIRTFTYWLWFIVPLFALVASIIAYRRHIKLVSDLAGMKSRRASRVAKRRLKKAEICLRKNNAEKFYDEMLLALWGYLGDKLDIPTSDLNRDNVDSILESKNINADIRAEVVHLLDECEFAKYAPSAAQGNMQQVYLQATQLINNIEEIFKNAKNEV